MNEVADAPSVGDVTIGYFVAVIVGDFCSYLRNCSLTLRRRLSIEAIKREKGDENSITANADTSQVYLGLDVDDATREVTRNGENVNFGRNDKAWQLFISVHRSGEVGKSRDDLLADVWATKVVNPNNLDQQKSRLNGILEPLRIEVETNNRGKWRLVDIHLC